MKHLRLGVLLLVQLLVASSVFADSDVRDWEGLAYAPNNSVMTWGYFRHVSSHSAAPASNFSQSLGVFRGTYILRFGNLSIVPFDATLPIVDENIYTELPGAPSYLNGSIHAEGVGDPEYFPTIAYTINEGADQSHTVLAFNPRVTLPVGSYDPNGFPNVGGNRLTFKPQVAIGQRFAQIFTAEAAAYMAFHGTNNGLSFPNPAFGKVMGQGPLVSSTMTQAPDFGLDVHLAADLSRTFFFGVSYYMLKTSDQLLTSLGNSVYPPGAAATVQTLRFSLGIRIEHNTLALLQFDQDISATSTMNTAPITRFFGIRLSHIFFDEPATSHAEVKAPPPPPPSKEEEPAANTSEQAPAPAQSDDDATE